MNVSASAGPGVDGAAASLIDRFEGIYGESGGDPKRIPWAHERACPWLVTWLDVEAPGLVRPGSRAAVVGCGLGNDAALLHERGYDVRAFDVCGTAVELAKRRHPATESTTTCVPWLKSMTSLSDTAFASALWARSSIATD